MNIFIIGTGGTGGYFGGMLAKNGADVTFLARGEHGQALRKNGLSLTTSNGNFVIDNPKVIEKISEITDPDLILVFVKSYSTDEIARELSEVVTKNTLVITFQTGLENDIRIARHVTAAKVFPGLTYVNSRIVAPGHIHQISGACTLIFGARDAAHNESLWPIEKLFLNAGIKARVSNTIEMDMWEKLVSIAAFSGATVLFRSTGGEIVDDVEGERVFSRLLQEGIDIAGAKGISFGPEARQTLFRKIDYHRGEGRNAKTSLLLDMENNRRTEFDTVHGLLVSYSQELSLQTPTLDLVAAAIRIYQRKLAAVG